MMEHVGIHENLKIGIWPKFTETATKLENMMVSPYEKNALMRSSAEKFQNTQRQKWELYAVSIP